MGALQKIVAFASLLASLAAAADSPQSGLWWSPNESGRGYALDAQGSTLVVTMFAYGTDGRMQWYYADGPLTNNGTSWQGTLLKLDQGQPLNGAYRAPTIVGNDGLLRINFTSRTTANITFPGGGIQQIQRQNFGVGLPPDALLGEWIFAFSIGTSDFMDRFEFTRVIAGTSSGNGIATNANATIGAELQVSGSLAGQILMIELNTSGTVVNRYIWTMHMEEGRGSWVSLITNNFYTLHAYKTRTRTGLAKQGARRASDSQDRHAVEGKAGTNSPESGTADLEKAVQEMAARLRAAG